MSDLVSWYLVGGMIAGFITGAVCAGFGRDLTIPAAVVAVALAVLLWPLLLVIGGVVFVFVGLRDLGRFLSGPGPAAADPADDPRNVK